MWPWDEVIHELVGRQCDGLVHEHAHCRQDAPLNCQLSLLWQMRRLAILVTGTRCPGLPGAWTLTPTYTYTHPAKNVAQTEFAQLRIIPSGQIYVFRDEQVAVEDEAKAGE